MTTDLPPNALLLSRRFGPLFVTQFLSAFSDNLFRTSLVFFAAYQLFKGDAAAAASLAAQAVALFVLPFFLVSGFAGHLCDARDKARVAQGVKLAEIPVMLVAAAGLWFGNLPVLLVALALAGVQAALFGPIKYGILPQHVRPGELLAANALVEGSTFVAVLLGQIAGGLLPPRFAGIVLVLLGVVIWLMSRAIPPAPPVLQTPGQGSCSPQPPGSTDREALAFQPLRQSWDVLRAAFSSRAMALTILGISWFWAMGALITAQFVPIVRNHLGAQEQVATLLLTCFSLGIPAGSLLVSWLLRGEISLRFAALSCVVMALGMADAARRTLAFPRAGDSLSDIPSFLALPAAWGLIADLLVFALAAGMFIAPLYARLQALSAPERRARSIAANNIANAGFVVASSVLAAVLLKAGWTSPQLILLLAAGTLGIALTFAGRRSGV